MVQFFCAFILGGGNFDTCKHKTDKETKGYNYKTVSTADTGLEEDLT